MRISDWSSDVCSSDLFASYSAFSDSALRRSASASLSCFEISAILLSSMPAISAGTFFHSRIAMKIAIAIDTHTVAVRSEEHTSELQSLMRSSYAVFCWKKQKQNNTDTTVVE